MIAPVFAILLAILLALWPGTLVENLPSTDGARGRGLRLRPFPGSVDLAVHTTASPDPVAPGSKISFETTVQNLGPDPARSVVLTDKLPVGTTFVSCASTSLGVCEGSGSDRRVTFTTLKAGKVATVILVASVDAGLPAGTRLTHSPRVQSLTDADPRQANNTASATSTVSASRRGVDGEWAGPFMWPTVAIHLSVLSDGRLLVWDSSNPAQIWNPAGDGFAKVQTRTTNSLFCAGHTYLPDGRLFVAGGHVTGTPPSIGSPDINIFDPLTNSWTRGPTMNAGRWYPSTTTLPNGDVLILSGNTTNQSFDKLPQVWQANGQLRDLTGAQLKLPIYPRIHVAPDGRVFYAGPGSVYTGLGGVSKYLDTAGNGAWTDAAAPGFGGRDYGTSVMYDEGKVLIVGGGGRDPYGPPPTATAEVIDLKSGGGWRPTNPMAFARRQLNATILADGKVLVTGGTSSPGFDDGRESVFDAEIWNPKTEGWTTVEKMAVRRNYHSVAALLPDGRVVSAGGTETVGLPYPDVSHQDAEFYSPPYLFKADGSPATRPRIESAPTTVRYQETFFVRTPNAASIKRVNWIRLSSVTHAFNETQRLNRLTFSTVSQGLNVTAPISPNLAPPGPYMLFLLDGKGVPSVARIVLIH
jgi:uncharacterized repeat protein (TIGR01451 family)